MKKFSVVLILLAFFSINIQAQLTATPHANAQALVQKLLGTGISVSNVTFTGNREMASFFNNVVGGFTNLGLDSGIVLTTGRARSVGGTGIVGNGMTPAVGTLAMTDWLLPGDAQLAAVIGQPVNNLFDACVLEFDFIPLGDSIRFDYIFSSEEYNPMYVCDFNDAFAFFISGPGIVGIQNIALVPGTSTPVSIVNINNIASAGCVNNPSYYVDNNLNTFFTHDGHTTVIRALSRVLPCQTYHLKLVIADVNDGDFDTGVFLKAGSLSSNAYTLENITQFDPANGNSYLVEGCVPGSIKIKRTEATANAQVIDLAYGGTAINSIDVQTLPTSVTIPAGSMETIINILPLIDNIAEGIEVLKIYTLAPCGGANALVTDSTELQIRDFDILNITPDTSFICRNSTVQFAVPTSYSTYTWDASATLSNLNISNPIASPLSGETTYYCTATIGSCNARDSAFIKVKDIELLSKVDVNCKNGNTGQIRVALGYEWQRPVQLAIGNQPYQADSIFNNLPLGTYWIKVLDAANCLDSIQVVLNQAYPDLTFTATTANATCTGGNDGQITVAGTGGLTNYSYQLNTGAFQNTNVFPAAANTYLVTIKDVNGCTFSDSVKVNFTNDLILTPGPDETICESKSIQISASGTADSYAWFPASTLTGSNTATPTANPLITTIYTVRATKGICMKTEDITVFVNPAPRPNAGRDTSVCFGGNVPLMATGGTQFTWTPSTYLDDATSATPIVRRPLDDIIYTVSSIDANGCNSLVSDNVEVKVTPAVRLFAGKDTVVAINQPIQLRAYETNNSGVINWIWTPSYGLNNPNIANPVTTLDRDITYLVTGITANQCEGSDSINVKVYKGPEIYVPKAFTPNRDGNNDVMRAIAVGMKTTKYFTIYGRWGQKIFSTSDFRRGWDGTINGSPQPLGTYVWIAEAVDYTGKVVQVKGTFVLLR